MGGMVGIVVTMDTQPQHESCYHMLRTCEFNELYRSCLYIVIPVQKLLVHCHSCTEVACTLSFLYRGCLYIVIPVQRLLVHCHSCTEVACTLSSLYRGCLYIVISVQIVCYDIAQHTRPITIIVVAWCVYS